MVRPGIANLPAVLAMVERWRPQPWVGSAIVILVGLLVLAPYVIAGPGNFLDDWFALRNARTDSWWMAAGANQWKARPVAAAVYAIAFGVIGARAWLHAMLAAAMLIGTGVVFERVLRRFIPSFVAVAVSISWLVVPNHTSLEAWPSALNIALSVLLLVMTVERLTVPRSNWITDVSSAMLLGLSVLAYEATVPAGVVAVLTVAAHRRDDRPGLRRLLLSHGIVLSATGTWMLVHWHPAKSDLDVWIDPVQIANGHISTGVVGDHIGAAMLGTVVLVVTLVSIYLLRRRPKDHVPGWPEALILVGWIVIALGAVPFLRYFYAPVGLGDRVTVVSGLGGAAVLVGVIGWVGARNVAVGGVLVGALVVGAVGNRVSLVRDYAVAADDSRRILGQVERRWPVPPDDEIVFGPYPVMKRNIVAFIDADWPVQWLYGTRSVSAGFTLEEEAFTSVPPPQRVDIVSISNLEAIDRVGP